jgi:hypothetical protein
MYFYYGLGLIAGMIAYLGGASAAIERDRPTASYTIVVGGRH